ncbi:MAG: hypothetical protein ABIH18_00960 [Candidatus Omnitrophota bacterium]
MLILWSRFFFNNAYLIKANTYNTAFGLICQIIYFLSSKQEKFVVAASFSLRFITQAKSLRLPTIPNWPLL